MNTYPAQMDTPDEVDGDVTCPICGTDFYAPEISVSTFSSNRGGWEATGSAWCDTCGEYVDVEACWEKV